MALLSRTWQKRTNKYRLRGGFGLLFLRPGVGVEKDKGILLKLVRREEAAYGRLAGH